MTSRAPDLGAVRFMPIERSNGVIRVLDQSPFEEPTGESASEEAHNDLQGVANWPRVHTAFRQRGVFVVETSTPIFHATLRFFPEQPHLGDYEICDRLTGRLERGRTITVRVVPSDDNDGMVSMLAPFATRYAVVTASAQSPHTRLIWLVGLKSFRHLEEKEGEPVDELPWMQARPSSFKKKCVSVTSFFKSARSTAANAIRPGNLPH